MPPPPLAARDPSPRPADPAAPGDATPRARWPTIAALCAIWAGLTLTENLSNFLLPLTLQRFTTDAAIIGLILALNPFFGFIANPLAGVIGDRLWTPLGRRATLLIASAPVVSACVLQVPYAAQLWHVIVLVALYQFFQDVLWGSNLPLLADLVPAPLRTLVSSALVMSAQATGWLFAHYGLGRWLDAYGEQFIYSLCAILQLALVGFAALFLREKPPSADARRRLTIRIYLRDFFAHAELRRFGLLAFWQFFGQHLLQGYYVLFAVQTLGLARGDTGQLWSWLWGVSFVCAFPFGWLSEHWLPKQRALSLGYLCLAGACVAGWFSNGRDDLLVSVVLFGLGQVMCAVTQKAFFMEFVPPALTGQLSGIYNVCLALGRTAALAGGGWLVSRLDNDYRWIFPFAFVASISCLFIVARIRDLRFERVRALRRQDPVDPFTRV